MYTIRLDKRPVHGMFVANFEIMAEYSEGEIAAVRYEMLNSHCSDLQRI